MELSDSAKFLISTRSYNILEFIDYRVRVSFQDIENKFFQDKSTLKFILTELENFQLIKITDDEKYKLTINGEEKLNIFQNLY